MEGVTYCITAFISWANTKNKSINFSRSAKIEDLRKGCYSCGVFCYIGYVITIFYKIYQKGIDD